MISQQNMNIKNGSTWHKVCPFPIGYIYMSTNSTSPASTYGGTWSALTDSRFLRPSDSWNSIGGSAQLFTAWSHRTTDEPHTYAYGTVINSGRWFNNRATMSIDSLRWQVQSQAQNEGMGVYGVDDKDNSLPPYRTCYAWYRTA